MSGGGLVNIYGCELLTKSLGFPGILLGWFSLVLCLPIPQVIL